MPTLTASAQARIAAHCHQAVERLVQATYARLQDRSPVGTGPNAGLLRANWRCGVNQLDPTVTLHTTPEPLSIPPWQLGDRIILSNSLRYARGLEYGHSSQAPTGVVGVTAAELLSGTLTGTR